MNNELKELKNDLCNIVDAIEGLFSILKERVDELEQRMNSYEKDSHADRLLDSKKNERNNKNE